MTAKPRTLVALAWTALIFGLCWTPRAMMPVVEEPSSPLMILKLDKIVHFAIFAGFGFLWSRAGARARWVVAAGVLAALVSELGQATAFVNREAEWADGTADALGVLAGVAAWALLRRLSGGPASARTPSAGTP